MILLFIGPSGSGKDTQADMLEKSHEFERVSTGDLMREVSDGENRMQVVLRKAMNQGFLSDNFTYGLLEIFLQDFLKDNLILSGVVRRTSQIDLLDTVLLKTQKKLDRVVYFELSDEEAIKRMSSRVHCPKCQTNYHLIFNPPKKEGICDECGSKIERRADDYPEAIKKRLHAFHMDNDEILEEYNNRGILIKIDASKGIEEINKNLKDELGLS